MKPSGADASMTWGNGPEKTETEMLKFLAKIETEALRHADYRRLRDEIARLSWREQLDMGIRASDAETLAYQKIYG